VGTVIQHGDGDDLIEEELVRLVELGSDRSLTTSMS
jgi:hypothetical protein